MLPKAQRLASGIGIVVGDCMTTHAAAVSFLLKLLFRNALEPSTARTMASCILAEKQPHVPVQCSDMMRGDVWSRW